MDVKKYVSTQHEGVITVTNVVTNPNGKMTLKAM